jgi:hypothetical protein
MDLRLGFGETVGSLEETISPLVMLVKKSEMGM